MIDWNKKAVEEFIGLSAAEEHWSSLAYVFLLPTPAGPIKLGVVPSEDRCQFFASEDENDFVSAYVHCTRITINEELDEEGGNCIVLQGKGGHACVSKGNPYVRLFFSMYGTLTEKNS